MIQVEWSGERPAGRLAVALTGLALVLCSAPGRAQEGSGEEGGWSVRLTPYVMLAGLKGDVGVRGQTAEVDASFSDIADYLNFAAMTALEARRGRLGLGADVIYMTLGADADITSPGPLVDRVEDDMSAFILSPQVSYRVTRPGPASVDLLGGIRYWHLSNTLKLTGETEQELEFEASQDWVEPLVGARLGIDFSDRWFGLARGDVGGFGAGSDFSWQALGAIGYRFDSQGRYSVLAGYRQLDVDYENDDDGFLFDVGMGGPTIAFIFAW